jgi:hypothetical protein
MMKKFSVKTHKTNLKSHCTAKSHYFGRTCKRPSRVGTYLGQLVRISIGVFILRGEIVVEAQDRVQFNLE